MPWPSPSIAKRPRDLNASRQDAFMVRYLQIVSPHKYSHSLRQGTALMKHAKTTLLAALALIGTLLLPSTPSAEDRFPAYEAIQPNVSFWIKIYSTYPTTRAVVHDSVDLGVVYEVIKLKPHGVPGARKTNRQRMKRARARYRDLLKRLAADPRTQNPEARRVAALFGPDAGARTFQRAAGRVRCQIGQKDRFRAGLVRSGAYIEEIRSILRAYGVPQDLAYLPHVESSFNPKAYSKFGAAGIWQFTRSTGKRFMTVGYEIDERRDPIRATHAAARLLKENHDRLGTWPLAITAYNHGASGVHRAKSTAITRASFAIIAAARSSSLHAIFIRSFWPPVRWLPTGTNILTPSSWTSPCRRKPWPWKAMPASTIFAVISVRHPRRSGR